MKELQEGIKFDSGKTKYTLLDWSFVKGMADVMTEGAEKYAEWNWVHLDKARIKDAMLRHIVAYLQGEAINADTKLRTHHLHHAACNAMMLLYLDKNETNTFEASEE